MRFAATPALLAAVLLASVVAAAARPPGAEQILRKAEDVRNPDLDYAVDFTIHGVSRGTVVKERDASYSMVARGKDRTVILMRSPEMLYGALVLMDADRYFMLLPKATKSWELSGAQMMNGDVATGDLARSNLTRGYAVTLSGEEPIDGEACYRLELTAQGDAARYTRIVYWVAKKGFLPMKLDHFGRAGELRKTVMYGDYRKGPLGLRSMRLTIESFDEWKEGSTLVFSNLRKLVVPKATFTSEGLIPFRDAALSAREATASDNAPVERIVGAMASPSPLK
jgi:hypothetical protein